MRNSKTHTEVKPTQLIPKAALLIRMRVYTQSLGADWAEGSATEWLEALGIQGNARSFGRKLAALEDGRLVVVRLLNGYKVYRFNFVVEY